MIMKMTWKRKYVHDRTPSAMLSDVVIGPLDAVQLESDWLCTETHSKIILAIMACHTQTKHRIPIELSMYLS